ncbi:MAG TPA: hypothetical protein VLX09_16185 [Stellaceae bacterium]|nr:hypothetical protein [Stellaceae bacterium]
MAKELNGSAVIAHLDIRCGRSAKERRRIDTIIVPRGRSVTPNLPDQIADRPLGNPVARHELADQGVSKQLTKI